MESKEERDLLSELKEHEQRVKRIERALLGDKAYSSAGIANKVDENSEQIEENTEKLNKILAAATAVGALAAIVTQIIFWVI